MRFHGQRQRFLDFFHDDIAFRLRCARQLQLGRTMSCGSAQLLSDLISSQRPAIRADDLAVFRYVRPDVYKANDAYA
jgi:hypothetical protein